MDFAGVKLELAKPAYDGLNDEACAVYMRTTNITPTPRTSMSGTEIFALTDAGEYAALTDAAKQQWLALCAIDSVDPYGPAEQVVADIMGAGPTASALTAARDEVKTIGESYGFARINEGDVRKARNY